MFSHSAKFISKMFSLIRNSRSDRYEIRKRCEKLSNDDEVLHSSQNMNLLKDFKFNIEFGFPKVVMPLMNDEEKDNNHNDIDMSRLISEVLEDNSEDILDEALKNDFIFRSDHELSESVDVENQHVQVGEVDNMKPKVVILQDVILNTNIDSNNTKPESISQVKQRKKAPQKKHCCLFCQKQVFKIYRHYLTVHKNENEVRNLALLPTKAPNRQRILDDLRKRGDYLYNTTKDENEPSIVCRNGNGQSDAVCCPNCRGFYSKFNLRNHLLRCDPELFRKKKGRTTIQPEARKMMNRLHCQASKELKEKIFPYMREDDVVNIIRYDEAVIQYGNYSCRKYTSEHHAAQIRSHLRAFGKLLLAAKQINPTIENMNNLLDARNVPLIIMAINKVAGLNEKTAVYRAPATAMSLGTELKKLSKLLQMEFIKTSDKDNIKRMKNLLTVFELEFNVTINKNGMESQKILKRRKTTVLPKTEVIAQFRYFLESKMRFYIGRLEKEFCKGDWVKLAEYTLVHLAVFNRKRPGETQRILIDDFKNYEVIEDNELENEDWITKEQSRKWARVKFTGKLGNDNALLVHRDLGFKAINLILKFRGDAGVNQSNRYIFGEPSQYRSQKTFQACNLIRRLSKESGIPNNELMRTRLLRQHLATETASHNVDSRLESRLSDFMSHNKKIHDVHYVLTKKKDDIMKVSTLLEDFSSTKKSPILSNEETVVAEHITEIREGISAYHSGATTSNSQKESYCEPSPSESSFSDHDEDRLSKSELNYVLALRVGFHKMSFLSTTCFAITIAFSGKQSRRLAWCKEEIELVKGTFKREIDLNLNISLAQVKEFYTRNIETMRRRSPHLIIQWIKGEQKRKQKSIANIKPKKERYTIEEQTLLEETISNHMREETLPSIAECSFLIEQNDVLSSRSPASIKSFVYNQIKKRKTI